MPDLLLAPTTNLSRDVARRFLILRHLLAPPRQLPPEPESVLRVIDQLGSLQFDPLEIAGRNHDLVLLARIEGYRRPWTDRWLYQDRVLYETYNKQFSIVPTAELPWYRVTWDRQRVSHAAGTFDEHAPLVEELLGRIRADGALSSTDFEARAAIDWYWRPTNQVRAILEALAEAGLLAISRREGNRRVYDLTERLFPAALLDERPSPEEQLRHKLLSRYRAVGLLGATGEYTLWMGTGPAIARRAMIEALVDNGALIPVQIDGLKRHRYVVAGELAILEQARQEVDAGAPPGGVDPGVAFLAPLDPLVWDRDLLRRLFDFDYVWEVYVPEKKRRWGYYVLPILYGDRLVGRIEPRIERRSGALRIAGLWWEPGFDPLADPVFAGAFARAVAAHRDFGGMEKVVVPRTVAHRPFITLVRAALGT